MRGIIPPSNERSLNFHKTSKNRVRLKNLDIVQITNPAEQLQLPSIHATVISDPVLDSYTRRHRQTSYMSFIRCSALNHNRNNGNLQVREYAKEWR